jgi:hypothetical protein
MLRPFGGLGAEALAAARPSPARLPCRRCHQLLPRWWRALFLKRWGPLAVSCVGDGPWRLLAAASGVAMVDGAVVGVGGGSTCCSALLQFVVLQDACAATRRGLSGCHRSICSGCGCFCCFHALVAAVGWLLLPARMEEPSVFYLVMSPRDAAAAPKIETPRVLLPPILVLLWRSK